MGFAVLPHSIYKLILMKRSVQADDHSCSAENICWDLCFPRKAAAGGFCCVELSPLRLLVHDSHDDQLHGRPQTSLYLSRVLLLGNNRQQMSPQAAGTEARLIRRDPFPGSKHRFSEANKPTFSFLSCSSIPLGRDAVWLFRPCCWLKTDCLRLQPANPSCSRLPWRLAPSLVMEGNRGEEGGGVFQSLFEDPAPSLSPHMLSVCPSAVAASAFFIESTECSRCVHWLHPATEISFQCRGLDFQQGGWFFWFL